MVLLKPSVALKELMIAEESSCECEVQLSATLVDPVRAGVQLPQPLHSRSKRHSQMK
jgi:hypothetical protein